MYLSKLYLFVSYKFSFVLLSLYSIFLEWISSACPDFKKVEILANRETCAQENVHAISSLLISSPRFSSHSPFLSMYLHVCKLYFTTIESLHFGIGCGITDYTSLDKLSLLFFCFTTKQLLFNVSHGKCNNILERTGKRFSIQIMVKHTCIYSEKPVLFGCLKKEYLKIWFKN